MELVVLQIRKEVTDTVFVIMVTSQSPPSPPQNTHTYTYSRLSQVWLKL